MIFSATALIGMPLDQRSESWLRLALLKLRSTAVLAMPTGDRPIASASLTSTPKMRARPMSGSEFRPPNGQGRKRVKPGSRSPHDQAQRDKKIRAQWGKIPTIVREPHTYCRCVNPSLQAPVTNPHYSQYLGVGARAAVYPRRMIGISTYKIYRGLTYK